MTFEDKLDAAGFTPKEFAKFCGHKSPKTMRAWLKNGAPKLAHEYLDERIKSMEHAKSVLAEYE